MKKIIGYGVFYLIIGFAILGVCNSMEASGNYKVDTTVVQSENINTL